MSMSGSVVLDREPLVTGNKTMADVNEDISRPLETFPTKVWYISFTVALFALVGIAAIPRHKKF